MKTESRNGKELLRRLSPAQVVVLRGIAAGKKPCEIAEEIHVGVHGVDYHRRRIYAVLGVQSNVEATRWVVEHLERYYAIP